MKIGAVSFLNTEPLIYGILKYPEKFKNFNLFRFDPSECAKALSSCEIDVGLIPSIEYLKRGYDLVDGIAIASRGKVLSVLLIVNDIKPKVLFLDKRSKTSKVLALIIFKRLFGYYPKTKDYDPKLGLPNGESFLIIGDEALYLKREKIFGEIIDLGGAWSDIYGLPFVYAVWAGKKKAVYEAKDGLLESKFIGLKNIEKICENIPKKWRDISETYLKHHIHYDLSLEEKKGLYVFFELSKDTPLWKRG